MEQKILDRTESKPPWTARELVLRGDVLRHIQENSVITKWCRSGRLLDIDLASFMCGDTRNYPAYAHIIHAWLPPGETWCTENIMSSLTHVAVMSYGHHSVLFFLIGSTWYSHGLSISAQKVKDVLPQHKPSISKTTLERIRKILPTLSAALKETSVVQFTVPDMIYGNHLLGRATEIYRICYENMYTATEAIKNNEKPSDMFFGRTFGLYNPVNDADLRWVGLCSRTTKVILCSLEYKPNPRIDNGSTTWDNRLGIKNLVVDWQSADKFNMNPAYSATLNNCSDLVQSLTGLPCGVLGTRVSAPRSCTFDRTTHPPDFSFLSNEPGMIGYRSTQTRLRDLLISKCSSRADLPGSFGGTSYVAIANCYNTHTIFICLLHDASDPIHGGEFVSYSIQLTVDGGRTPHPLLTLSHETIKNTTVYKFTEVTDYSADLLEVATTVNRTSMGLNRLSAPYTFDKRKIRSRLDDAFPDAKALWDCVFTADQADVNDMITDIGLT